MKSMWENLFSHEIYVFSLEMHNQIYFLVNVEQTWKVGRLQWIGYIFHRRPETSFFWFTSPWKTFKHIVWKRFKKYFITGLIIFLIGLFLFLFFYNLPVSSAILGREWCGVKHQ